MNSLIICKSIHHGNTKKIASAIAEVLQAEIVSPEEVSYDQLNEYDLIGFGSGIYFSKLHRSIEEFVDEMPILEGGKAFLFFTHGLDHLYWARLGRQPVSEKLEEKGFEIVGEFGCKGYQSNMPFRLVGGINKGRPNEEDLEASRDFAGNLLAGMT
ncbi:flavodoxin [Candidatus Thorarchaeota archaeon]|nr:MAG: flavodoxin [Candidatus Thorarchaeota archaeon]